MKFVFVPILLSLFAHKTLTLADADTLRVHAENELSQGQMSTAHALFLQAIDAYAEFPDTERQISLCYYQMAIAYNNSQDTAGMQGILQKMQALCRQAPANPYVNYDYWSVSAVYNTSRFEWTEDTLYRDLMMLDGKQAIRYLEQLTHEQRHEAHINSVWNYYNVAIQYDLYYSPQYRDSVRLYLDKARVANAHPAKPLVERQEGDISIRDMQAWLYFYDGEYALAEQEIMHVLALVDTVSQECPNFVISERGEAYSFLVTLYEKQGRYQDALHYQQLLEENNRIRFSAEHNRALHEVEAQYQHALQAEQISKLRHTTFFLAGTLVLLLLGMALAVVVALLKRKNKELQRYQEALDADLVKQVEHTNLQAIREMLLNDFPTAAEQLSAVHLERVSEIIAQAEAPLSIVDKRYLMCFMAGLKPQEIAALFHVEPASVYTVRYRIRKKFPKNAQPPI